MSDEMVKQAKAAAFFLWEYSGCGDTLALWYCAEDIACFLERCGITNMEGLYDVLRLNKNSAEYKDFIRQLAYRVHLYANSSDETANWYTAEKLIMNNEWREAVIYMASAYKQLREGKRDDNVGILSEKVKEYYRV